MGLGTPLNASGHVGGNAQHSNCKLHVTDVYDKIKYFSLISVCTCNNNMGLTVITVTVRKHDI